MDVKPDILHVHEPELLGPVLRLAGTRPVIWDVHESYLDVVADRAWIPKRSRRAAAYVWDRYERRLVTRCAAVVAATPRVAARYRALHDRVVTVANYPPVTRVNGHHARKPLSCCFTGVMSENRGLRTVIQALSLLKGRGLEVRLELAGRVSPEYLSQLHQMAAGLDVAHLVQYHGVLERDEVLALQSTCAVGLVPHLAHGNNLAAWPVKMFEFMANATPMVFSDLPSHQEIAGRAGAGLPVKAGDSPELADAIERLLTSPALARQMGEAGRKAIDEHFNWQAEARKLTQLYDELAQACPST
jgi:glycosyltransferase involved in cell wall biosynthesis